MGQSGRCGWWGEDTNRIEAERLRPKNTTSQGCEEKAGLVGGPGLFNFSKEPSSKPTMRTTYQKPDRDGGHCSVGDRDGDNCPPGRSGF